MVNSVGKSMLSSMTEDEWEESETAVNAFTLVHHDLNMCTNSAQYVMLLDIINNLLLYSEPTQKVRKKSCFTISFLSKKFNCNYCRLGEGLTPASHQFSILMNGLLY